MLYEPFTDERNEELELEYLEEDLYAFLRMIIAEYHKYYACQRGPEIWFEAKSICCRLGNSKHPNAIISSCYEKLLRKYEYYCDLYDYGELLPHNEYAAKQVLICCYYMVWTSPSLDCKQKKNLLDTIATLLDDWKDSVLNEFNKMQYQASAQKLTFEDYDYTIPHQDVIVSDDVNASKAKIKELEIEIRKLTEIIETYNKAPIADNPHDKVRLELFCKLIETSGATFQKHGNKAKIAQIAHFVTGLPLQTCANYMTERNLNTEAHKEEILNLNSKLQSINSSIRL